MRVLLDSIEEVSFGVGVTAHVEVSFRALVVEHLVLLSQFVERHVMHVRQVRFTHALQCVLATTASARLNIQHSIKKTHKGKRKHG